MRWLWKKGVNEGESPERTVGYRVTASYFDVFGVRPARGREFGVEEDQPGHEQVVVGVMLPSFDLTAESEELWVPIALTPAASVAPTEALQAT